MRSDYLGDCAEFHDLPEALNDCQYLIPRMTREQRKAAIEGPLGRVEIAPVLVQRLLNDAGDEPDQLPVLQHALMRTWNHWHKSDPNQTRRIEVQDYEAIGGLANALDQHADELLAGVPAEVTAAIFKRLTAKGRGSRERRNPARLAELWAVCGAKTPERQAEVTAVVDHFRRGEATFLVPRDGAIGADTYIDITHESLIRQWKKLRDAWLPEEQKSAKTFLDLTERARNFNAERGELLIGLDLADAVEWDRTRNPTERWAAHYAPEEELGRVLTFIRASEDQRDEQARTQRERRRRRIVTTVAGLLVAGGFAAILFWSYANERRARDEAFGARIRSVPSVRDPLARALLLAELGDYARRPEDLAIYQEVVAAAIPLAVLRYSDSVVAAGFRGDGGAALVLRDGTLLSWRSDGRGDPIIDRFVEPVKPLDGKAATRPPVDVAAFSRDGRWIAAGLAGGAVWVGRTDRTPPSRVTAAPLAQGSTSVSALAFSRDGRKLAAGYADYDGFSVRVWQLDGTSEGVLTTVPSELAGAHAQTISAVDFDPTGARVVSGSWDGTTRIWRLDGDAKGSVVFDGQSPVWCVAFSPDGAWVLTGHESGAIQIQKSDRGGTSVASSLPTQPTKIVAAAFSPDGSKVVTAAQDRTARVWTIRSRDAKNESGAASLEAVGSPMVLTHDGQVTSLAFREDGARIVTVSADGTARVWPSEQQEPRILGLHDRRIESVAVSLDGKRVVSASDDRTARIWGLDGVSKPQVLSGHSDWVRSAAFSPAGGDQVLTASEDGTLRLWNTDAPASRTLSEEGGPVFAAAFDRKGARVVTAVRDNVARVWTMSSLLRGGQPLETGGKAEVVELRHDDWVLGAAFSGDGSKIVTASKDGTVRTWAADRSSSQPLRVFVHPHGTVVFGAAFSPDGSRIVTASSDGVARIWPAESQEEPVFLRHTAQVNKAIFSSSGTSIVTASDDGTARVWRTRDGTEQIVLQHGTEAVRAAAFDQNDGRVVTGTEEGVIRIWRVTLPALKDYLRQASTACISPTIRVQFLGESEETALSKYTTCERGYDRTPTRPARPAGTDSPARGPSQP